MFWLRERRYMRRRQRAVAMHEATHAVIGMRLGLPVAWASIVPGYDAEEKMYYPAAVKIVDEANQNQRLVLASMAAPAYVPSGDEGLDGYAEWEAATAYRKAEELGYDPITISLIRSVARREGRTGRREIRKLARRLTRAGYVELGEAA
jgi:hypothetical protein